MGETRVDLLHLLEDLRDAYPGALEETILTEIVANALDSGATEVRLLADPPRATFAVVDNGSGMTRRELGRYHDIASTGKTRGQGIGFAGVGIKLGLLAAQGVVTESRRGKTHVATSWRLASRTRAPWRWVQPAGLVETRGTAVTLGLGNALSPLLDPGYLETALRRHFAPLFDAAFAAILGDQYPQGVRFLINAMPLAGEPASASRTPLAIRMARKRKPSAAGYLVLREAPLDAGERGVALSTFGKVIKRGWDWLGLSPVAGDRICGLIEAPAMAEALTLNKADFIRTGARGATYLTFRKAIQEAVTAQLVEWGDRLDSAQPPRHRGTRAVERDLENVLVDLAQDFPLLASLVQRRPGGQRRLPFGGSPEEQISFSAPLPPASSDEGPQRESVPGEAETGPEPELPPVAGEDTPARVPVVDQSPGLPGGRGPKRPVRYGLALQFESRPDDEELGRLVESTVWVNDAHPAHRRAVASRSEGYHLALTVALALAPLAAEAGDSHQFVTSFLTRWGEAADGKRSGRGRTGRKRRAPLPGTP
jgi:hypothetical protein